MQIKKIRSKVDFQAEAQVKCPHGEKAIDKACTKDCKRELWYGHTAYEYLVTSVGRLKCKATTTYTCMWSCHF